MDVSYCVTLQSTTVQTCDIVHSSHAVAHAHACARHLYTAAHEHSTMHTHTPSTFTHSIHSLLTSSNVRVLYMRNIEPMAPLVLSPYSVEASSPSYVA